MTAAMLALFDDAGFILGSYALTFGAVGVLAWRYVRSGRRLAEQVSDDDKYWA